MRRGRGCSIGEVSYPYFGASCVLYHREGRGNVDRSYSGQSSPVSIFFPASASLQTSSRTLSTYQEGGHRSS